MNDNVVRIPRSIHCDDRFGAQRDFRRQPHPFSAGNHQGRRNDERNSGASGAGDYDAAPIQVSRWSHHHRVARQSVGQVANIISQGSWSASRVDLSQPRTEIQQRSKGATDRDAGIYLGALRQRGRVRCTSK